MTNCACCRQCSSSGPPSAGRGSHTARCPSSRAHNSAARAPAGNERRGSMPRHCPMARPTTSATPAKPTAEAATPGRRERRAGRATGVGSGDRGPRRDEIGMMSSRESTGVPRPGRCRTRAIPLPRRVAGPLRPHRPSGPEKCTPRPARRRRDATRSVAIEPSATAQDAKGRSGAQRRPGPHDHSRFASCFAPLSAPPWSRASWRRRVLDQLVDVAPELRLVHLACRSAWCSCCG